MTLYWLPSMPAPLADPVAIRAAVEGHRAERQELLERARSSHDFGQMTERQLLEFETYISGPLDPRD